MKKSKNKAFSLIELSVVIIIIGILIAGVIQGSTIILKAKYNTARALTESSPVAATKGLRLWLETTLDESIPNAESIDDSNVTVWRDISTQTGTRLFARNGASTIKYKFNEGINSVPSLYFPAGDASTTFFTLSFSKDTTKPTSIPTRQNAFTYFIVAKADAIGATNNLFYNGTVANNGWGYGNSPTNKTILFDSGISNVTGNAALSKAEVISVVYDGLIGDEIAKLYVNGVLDSAIGSTTTVSVESPRTGLYIGSNNATGSATDNWQGYISEIIIFDKKLPNAHRKAIESYLGQKYSINIS